MTEPIIITPAHGQAAVDVLAALWRSGASCVDTVIRHYHGGGSGCSYAWLYAWEMAGAPVHDGINNAYVAARVPDLVSALGGRVATFDWRDPRYGPPRAGDGVLLDLRGEVGIPDHVGTVRELVIRTDNGRMRVNTIEGGYRTKAGPNRFGRDFWTEPSGRVVGFLRPVRAGRGCEHHGPDGTFTGRAGDWPAEKEHDHD